MTDAEVLLTATHAVLGNRLDRHYTVSSDVKVTPSIVLIVPRQVFLFISRFRNYGYCSVWRLILVMAP